MQAVPRGENPDNGLHKAHEEPQSTRRSSPSFVLFAAFVSFVLVLAVQEADFRITGLGN
jgi:hypothetical protein